VVGCVLVEDDVAPSLVEVPARHSEVRCTIEGQNEGGRSGKEGNATIPFCLARPAPTWVRR
jgi:hypothetical protein